MLVRVKLLNTKARLPERAHDGDAGADLYAAHGAVINPGDIAKIGLGVALEIPEGYEGQIRPRSGLMSRGIVGMFGTIDAGYRGEVMAILLNTTRELFRVDAGDRVAQLVISAVPRVVFEASAELSDSARGTDGFGSTGIAGPRRPGNSG